MKTRLFAILLLLIFVFSVPAQDVEKQIKEIRAAYTSVSQLIAETEADPEKARYGELAVNELVINKLERSWAAVGNYKVVFRFYYQNMGEEPYPTELVKVTKKTESAARRYSEEFLFDTTGALIFYFEKSEDGVAPEERRLYFQKGKAIRIVEDAEKRDKLTSEDLDTAKDVVRRGARVRDVFLRSIED